LALYKIEKPSNGLNQKEEVGRALSDFCFLPARQAGTIIFPNTTKIGQDPGAG
jgi:hypothetical protein